MISHKEGIKFGAIDDYVWIIKYDIHYFVKKRCLYFISPYVACMTIGHKKRNLSEDSKNIKDKYIVCIRWNFIREDTINFKKTEG